MVAIILIIQGTATIVLAAAVYYIIQGVNRGYADLDRRVKDATILAEQLSRYSADQTERLRLVQERIRGLHQRVQHLTNKILDAEGQKVDAEEFQQPDPNMEQMRELLRRGKERS